METIKDVLCFFLFIILFVLSFRTLFTYFCGETKNVEVYSVKKLLPRDATATAVVIDNGERFKVFFCSKKIKAGEKIEVFYSDFYGLMMCTSVSKLWIICCLCMSIVSFGLCFFTCNDLYKRIRKECT